MLFNCNCEFRGKTIKTNEKGNYYYVSLASVDDESGEALKLQSEDFTGFIKDIKKGDIVTAYIDYNLTYKSLKLVNLKKVK